MLEKYPEHLPATCPLRVGREVLSTCGHPIGRHLRVRPHHHAQASDAASASWPILSRSANRALPRNRLFQPRPRCCWDLGPPPLRPRVAGGCPRALPAVSDPWRRHTRAFLPAPSLRASAWRRKNSSTGSRPDADSTGDSPCRPPRPSQTATFCPTTSPPRASDALIPRPSHS